MNQTLKRNILAFLIFVFLTLLAAWSVISNLDNVLIGNDNDVYINPWADWWTLQSLQEAGQTLWQTEMMFYPQGANLIFHSFSHFNTAVSLALLPFVGIIPAYNLGILLNYVLAGVAMYQFAYYLTKSNKASLLAGVIFTFNSHNQYQSAHPVLVSVWCIPWLTLCFFHAVRENSVKWAVLAAVVIFLGAVASTLLLVIMGLWLVFLVVYMLLAKDWPRPPWRILLIVAGLGGLLVLPLLFPMLQEAFLNRNTTFSRDPAGSIITDVISIFVPHWYFWVVRGMYIGIFTSGLVIFAIIRKRREAALWLWVVALSFLLAIGPDLQIVGFKPGITLPWSYLIIPTLRNPYRMMILFSLGIAMLAAYGWLAIEANIAAKRTQQWAGVVLILLIFVDYTATPFPTTPATVSDFYIDFLQDVPDDVVLATVPYGRQEDKRYLFYQTFHGQPITGGVISRADEPNRLLESNTILRAGMVDLDPVPLPADWETPLKELADRDIGYLVLDKNLLEDFAMWQAQIPIEAVYEDDLVVVYKVKE